MTLVHVYECSDSWDVSHKVNCQIINFGSDDIWSNLTIPLQKSTHPLNLTITRLFNQVNSISEDMDVLEVCSVFFNVFHWCTCSLLQLKERKCCTRSKTATWKVICHFIGQIFVKWYWTICDVKQSACLWAPALNLKATWSVWMIILLCWSRSIPNLVPSSKYIHCFHQCRGTIIQQKELISYTSVQLNWN